MSSSWGAHHRREHAAPPVGRQNTDHGHAGARHDGSRDCQLKRKRTGAADDPVTVEGRMHPLDRQHSCEPLGAFVVRSAAEVVGDGADGGLELRQILRRADIPGHSELLRAIGRQIGAKEERRGLESTLAALLDDACGREAMEVDRAQVRRRRGRRCRARGRPCPRCGPRRRPPGSGPRSKDRARRSPPARRTCPGGTSAPSAPRRGRRAAATARRPAAAPSARGSRTRSGSRDPGSKWCISTRTVRSIWCR